MTEKTGADVLKITNQFRSRTGFVYELRVSGVRLTVNVWPRQGPDDPGEWRVDAHANTTPEVAAIAAWGPTRIDALREVGRLWLESTVPGGLPRFDWDAVATALSNVRAV